METVGYDQFSESDEGSHHGQKLFPKLPSQGVLWDTYLKGKKHRVPFILYGILLFFTLMLVLIVGVKFAQLHEEITDIKLYLKASNVNAQALSTHSEHRQEHDTLPFSPEPVVPERGSCDEDWVSFKSSCYFLSPQRTNWHTAELQCSQKGAHLLVLNSEEELDYMNRVLRTRVSYWIGLVERAEEGNWTWVDGTDFESTPHFWDEGQPDDWKLRVNGEDCGMLHSAIDHKLWNDADCTLSHLYVCEGKAKTQRKTR